MIITHCIDLADIAYTAQLLSGLREAQEARRRTFFGNGRQIHLLMRCH